MLLLSDNVKIKYAGTFLLASGVYPNIPGVTVVSCTLTAVISSLTDTFLHQWTGNNIGGSTKRSVGMAMQVGVGNLGGVLSAYMYLPRDSPRYRKGHTGLVVLELGGCVLAVLMSGYLRWENGRRDRMGKPAAQYSREEKMVQSALGDYADFFRYTV